MCAISFSFVIGMSLLFTCCYCHISQHCPAHLIHSHCFHAFVFLCFSTVPLSLPLHSNLGILMETIELKVEMVALHEKRLRRCLSKVKGIEKVEVEISIQKVVVTGYAQGNKILRALRRVGLRAEFWSPQNEILSAYAGGSLMMNNFGFF